MGRLIFILGGIKSGKSLFSERLAAELAEKQESKVIYLATAQVCDEEMSVRIKKHKARRPEGWQTIEEPLHPEEVISSPRVTDAVVLLDCLNLYMSNLLFEYGADKDDSDRFMVMKNVLTRIDDLASSINKCEGTVIIVSNEVGMSLVSPNRLGRLFQELTGTAHQIIAHLADEVYFVTAGLPQKLKGGKNE